MVKTATLLALALTAGAFAGCVNGESTPITTVVHHGPAKFTDDTGGIEGYVTDDELVPLAGAIVGIVQSDVITREFSATTDEYGAFSLNHVPPGVHAVQASFLGYRPVAKYVGVYAGSPSHTALALERIPANEAFGETIIMKASASNVMWRLSPECLYFGETLPPDNPARTQAKTCGGLRLGCSPDICETHFFEEFLPETRWKTIVAQLAWTAQSGATGRGFTFDVNAPNITRGDGGSIDQSDPYTWQTSSAASPITIRVDNPTTLQERGIKESDYYSYPEGRGCSAPDYETAGNCDWFFRIFGGRCDVSSTVVNDCRTAPVDFGLGYDQPFTVYFSYFYVEPAEQNFSALPDV